jgi:tetratricopeptide (TPR) repeat protein
VRASRARLYHALTACGLRSQAALAERIADLEDLEQAPKDLVSRVFREQPVELQTIERVARALGVEAWQLYLTSDEHGQLPGNDAAVGQADADADAVSDSHAAPVARTRARWLAPALAVTVAAAVGLWWSGLGSGDRAAGVGALPGRLLPAAQPTVVVLPTEDDPGGLLAAALRQRLEQKFRLAAPTADLLIHGMDTDQVAALLRSDAVVEGGIRQLGRFAGVRVYLHRDGTRQQVWAETVSATGLERSLDEVAETAVRAIAHALGDPVTAEDWPMHYPLAPVQDYYLEGRMHLDGPSSELNIRRAQARFEAALRLDANYAEAHAGLCEALLEEYWMEDAQRALHDASLACGRALQLAPGAASTQVAHAHFLRVTGRVEESAQHLHALLAERPGDGAALLGLALTLLQAYRSEGDAELVDAARTAARQATELEPGFWKPPFWLASLAYFAGDLPDAIAAAEEALARDENEYVLANLGTFYFCAEQLEDARGAYERAKAIAPQSYVGDEFLGMLYYLLGDYPSATQLREQAIERLNSGGQPEIHEMWGNLGDAYFRSGRREEAAQAFRRAVEIAERDVLQGIETPADRASRAYYYSQLADLVPDSLPADIESRVQADLLAALEDPLDPGTAVRVATAWVRYERPELAMRAFEQAIGRCRGYAHTPGLDSLRQ